MKFYQGKNVLRWQGGFMDEVNPVYLKEKVMYAIRAELEKKGCVQLREFLTPRAYHRAMKKVLLRHQFVPDKYSFQEGKGILLLSVLSLIISTNVKMYLRVFKHRDYLLLHDDQNTSKSYDILLDLQNMDESWGGWSSYVRDSVEVVRIFPIANALTIVRREAGTRSFVKYVNHHALNPRRMLFARVTFK